MPKVVVSDAVNAEAVEELRKAGCAVVFDDRMSAEKLAAELADADALIVRSKTKVDAKLLDAAKRLKVVGRAGAGVDNIDLPAASARGVIVMNTPGGNANAAAEHTMAMMLALARKLPQADASMRTGEWDKNRFLGIELKGKTLAVLGLGKIGKIVARRARAFGMTVLAYDPYVNADYLKDVEVELISLEECCKRADFITLHLPSTPETEQLIGDRTISRMKKGARIINCARGTLVNEPEVIAALKHGRLAAAAFDVFPDEPKVNPELLALPNVVLTPHIAGSTAEAQEQVGFDITRQVLNYLHSGEVVGAVNFPSLPKEESARMRPFFELAFRLGQLAGQIGAGPFDEIAIRYYGELAGGETKLLNHYALLGALRAGARVDANLINAAAIAKERGIKVVETKSSRERGYSHLISVRLRAGGKTTWVEGAVLQPARLRIVSVDGIDIEAPLTSRMLLIRNRDTPGVIGAVGAALGEARVNIANFALGRGERDEAVGLVNVDGEMPSALLEQLRALPAIRDARAISLD